MGENLQDWTTFAMPALREVDCAFRKMDTLTGDCLPAIQDAITEGFWLRTRANIPISTITSIDTTILREVAFVSDAQIVSTDGPVQNSERGQPITPTKEFTTKGIGDSRNYVYSSESV